MSQLIFSFMQSLKDHKGQCGKKRAQYDCPLCDLSKRRELPARTRQARMEMPDMSASIVAKRTGIRPATGNTRKRSIQDIEERHSITFFSYAPLFKYRQKGCHNLQILREQFTANMLAVFCLKCLLHTQTLQVGLQVAVSAQKVFYKECKRGARGQCSHE